MRKKFFLTIVYLIFACAIISAYSDDRSGEMSVKIEPGYSLITMADYNKFAGYYKIQSFHSAFYANGDILFNLNNSIAAALRLEYVGAIPGTNSGDFTSSLMMTPVEVGMTGNFNLNESVYLRLGIYGGYEWAYGVITQNTTASGLITPAADNIYGSGFCLEGDAGVFWHLPFNDAFSAGITAGLRYAYFDQMKAESDSYWTAPKFYSGQAIQDQNGKTLDFDMSGVNFGLALKYEF